LFIFVSANKIAINTIMGTKLRLILMNFLQYAIWGAYLTSMGRYLGGVGLGGNIGIFYAVQGLVSLLMPTVVGIVADRWVPAQKMLGLCHLLAAVFMAAAGYYGLTAGIGGGAPDFAILFTLYTLSVAFYMPTIALSNSVAYSILTQSKLDPVKAFPPIRVFGTVGFICAMLATNFVRFDGASMQTLPHQFLFSAVLALVLGLYAFTLPAIPVRKAQDDNPLTAAVGFNAFKLFKQRKMAVFFIFSMLLGVSLQITNGFANPFIGAFEGLPEFADAWGTNNANALISLSQMSETLCILLIPFCLRRLGIKRVMLIAMVAWTLRFGLFGAGDPGSGVWMFVLSMIVYGIAFDFFNISGSLYVDQETDPQVRSSAQGLFMMMTNGVGATIGTLGAQVVVDHFVFSQTTPAAQVAGWHTAWYIFAAYALVVAIVFAVVFRYKHTPPAKS
jgi:nucleoside transporter